MNDVSDEVNVKSLFEKSNETLDDQKVLGVKWNPATDAILSLNEITFKQKKIMSENPDENEDHSIPLILTKRIILSQINAFFDPLGLASPFAIRAKILMRRLWIGKLKNLSWDDPISAEKTSLWVELFEDSSQMRQVTFRRCLKPIDVSDEAPKLIMFSDASESAYGA